MQKTANLAYFCEIFYAYSDWHNYGVVTDVSLYKFLLDSYMRVQNVASLSDFTQKKKK